MCLPSFRRYYSFSNAAFHRSPSSISIPFPAANFLLPPSANSCKIFTVYYPRSCSHAPPNARLFISFMHCQLSGRLYRVKIRYERLACVQNLVLYFANYGRITLRDFVRHGFSSRNLCVLCVKCRLYAASLLLQSTFCKQRTYPC